MIWLNPNVMIEIASAKRTTPTATIQISRSVGYGLTAFLAAGAGGGSRRIRDGRDACINSTVFLPGFNCLLTRSSLRLSGYRPVSAFPFRLPRGWNARGRRWDAKGDNCMLLLFITLAAAGNKPAYFVSLFEPAIETAPSLAYEYWNDAPSIDDLRMVAERGRRDGLAGLRCSIAQNATLNRCRVVNQLGGDLFGSAALRLAHKFRMKSDLAQRARAADSTIFIQLQFCVRVVCNPPEWPGYRPARPEGM